MTTDEPHGDYASHNAYIAQLERDLAAARADNEATSQALHQALVAKDDLWDEAQRYVIERDSARAELDTYKEGHLRHPAHTVDSSGGGICVHCGRTLHALPAYEDALEKARAEADLAAARAWLSACLRSSRLDVR